MGRIITKELAEKIVTKLGGIKTSQGGAHDIYAIYHGKILITSIGIRRGSEKDKGHDHIPRQIFVGPNFAKGLAQCSKTQSHWVEEMRSKGKIPADD